MTETIGYDYRYLDTYLKKLFARAGIPDNKYRKDEGNLEFLSENGARRFKRRALGLCGRSALKSLDEIAGLLVKTGIASSLSEGREIVPNIVRAGHMPFGVSIGSTKTLSFDEIKNKEGDVKYRITAWELDGCL